MGRTLEALLRIRDVGMRLKPCPDVVFMDGWRSLVCSAVRRSHRADWVHLEVVGGHHVGVAESGGQGGFPGQPGAPRFRVPLVAHNDLYGGGEATPSSCAAASGHTCNAFTCRSYLSVGRSPTAAPHK